MISDVPIIILPFYLLYLSLPNCTSPVSQFTHLISWTLVYSCLLFPSIPTMVPFSFPSVCYYFTICAHISRLGGRNLRWKRMVNVCVSRFEFLHSVWSFLEPRTYIQISLFHFTLQLKSILWYLLTSFSFYTHWL